MFFQEKRNKGQALKNKWIFGFVERGTDKFYAEVAEKRDAKTLIPIIQKRISTDTKLLLTNEWRSYFGLSDRNFRYKTKYKDHFLDPKDREIHTQTIENR